MQHAVAGPPRAGIEQLRKATRRLLTTIDDLTDDQAHAPSRLPDWSRAEVIAHIARNADGIRNLFEAAARGEIGDQYPGGAKQRTAEIAAGRDVRAAALRSDLRHACDRFTEACVALPAEGWDLTGRTFRGERTLRDALWIRWREIEVHHVDLDLGYEASDWPVGFVSGALDEIFGSFGARASSARPLVDAEYRVISTDHERGWRVALRGESVRVGPDDGEADDGEAADGEARGWGCDVAAWLYGRGVRGGGIVASGDLGVLRLPQWFPFA